MATQGAAGNPSPTNIVITLQELAIETYGNRLILQINIPVINVTSPVITVGWRSESISGLQDELTSEWDSPGAAVGWVLTSALPGQTGNIILYGHNNLYGSIFKDLGNLSTGDGITLTTGQGSWEYHVDQSLLLPILSSDEEGRRAYQAYLQPTTAPRLTIISCWPPESNTHRVVIIAYPVYVP